MLEDALKFAESLENPLTVLILLIVALGALVWRFLDKKLQTVAAQNDALSEQTAALSDSLVTNHGSRNMGDAVDRLTEMMYQAAELNRRTDLNVQAIRTEVMLYKAMNSPLLEWVAEQIASNASEAEASQETR